MSDRDRVNDLIEVLQRERDELRVKLHLAGQEAKQEYDRLTDRIGELVRQYEPTRDAVEETAENVWAALKLAAEEMKAGFGRVRKSLESDE
ncbi:MAG: hypothetical protein KDA61_19485 [Planctomycetales bacterium]|nr:hypothetical protein [Planctomycetales bacterium]